MDILTARTATLVVGSLAPVLDHLQRSGADVLAGPVPVPAGTGAVVRPPDGSVVEYLQPSS